MSFVSFLSAHICVFVFLHRCPSVSLFLHLCALTLVEAISSAASELMRPLSRLQGPASLALLVCWYRKHSLSFSNTSWIREVLQQLQTCLAIQIRNKLINDSYNKYFFLKFANIYAFFCTTDAHAKFQHEYITLTGPDGFLFPIISSVLTSS